MAGKYQQGNIQPNSDKEFSMPNYFSPNAKKSPKTVVLAGLMPKTNTLTINPLEEKIISIRWRANDLVKVHYNSDLKAPPENYFEATEGIFSINTSMRTVHFTVASTQRPVKLCLEYE